MNEAYASVPIDHPATNAGEISKSLGQWLRKHMFDLFFCIAAAVVAMSLGLAATVFGPGVSPDAVSYIGMADNLYHGRGFVVSLAGPLDPNAFSPVTWWPPGYSLTIAGLMVLGVSAVQAARLVSLLSFGLLIVVIYGLSLRLQGRLAAVLASVTMIALMPVVRLATFALSDMLFTAFVCLAALAMVSYATTHPKRQPLWLLIAAASTAVALLTRYVGFGLVLAGVIVVLWQTRERLGARLVRVAAFVIATLLPLLPWLLRNQSVAGQLFGFDRRVGYHAALPENIRYLFTTIAGDLLPAIHLNLRETLTSLFRSIWLDATLVGVIILTLVLYVRYRQALRGFLFHAPGRPTALRPHERGAVIVGLYAVILSAMLLVLSSTTEFAPYDWPRYIAPTYPLLLSLWIYVCARVVRSATQRWPAGGSQAALGLVSLLWLIPYGVQTAGFVPAAAVGQEYTAPLYRQNQGLQYLQRTVSRDDTVYSDKPDVVSFLLDRPARYLPFSHETETVAAMLRPALRPPGAARYIFAFKGIVEDAYFPVRLSAANLAALAAQTPTLVRVAEFDDSVIYRLDELTHE